ncbi:abortive infection family protein [Kushneria sp. EE4]
MALARTLLCTEAFSLSADANHLAEQKERLEQALERQDCSLVLDTSKSLLETVFKTILSDRLSDVNLSQDMKPLYRSIRGCLQFNVNEGVNKNINNMASVVVHNVAELRNSYGAASHGDDGYFENPVTLTDADLIANISDALCCYLYKRHKESSDPNLSARVYYEDYPDFNDWLDGQFPGWFLPSGGEILPSLLLYKHDNKEYREALLQYISSEEDDDEVEHNV